MPSNPVTTRRPVFKPSTLHKALGDLVVLRANVRGPCIGLVLYQHLAHFFEDPDVFFPAISMRLTPIGAIPSFRACFALLAARAFAGRPPSAFQITGTEPLHFVFCSDV